MTDQKPMPRALTAKYTFNREPKPMPKSQLEVGRYYVGVCRNANIARWTGKDFRHWRNKWGNWFIETIKHREDDDRFDVFDAWMRVDPYEVREITLDEETTKT